MVRRLAVNKWLVDEGGTYVGLPMPETEEEAREEMAKLGLSGVLISREDYAPIGNVEKKRQAKIDLLIEKLANVSLISLVKPEALSAKGEKYLNALNKIKQLEKATEAEIDSYDPEADNTV